MGNFRKTELDNSGGKVNANPVRAICVKQLIGMIKDFAAGELEMKTLMEFASSISPLNRRLDLSGLRSSYAKEKNQDPTKAQNLTKGSCESMSGEQVIQIFGDDQINQITDDKSRFLSDLVANIDHWIDTLERFTVTHEWTSLMKIFKGTETILNMFVTSSSKSPEKQQLANSTTNSSSTNDDFIMNLKQQLPDQVQTLTTALNQLLPWHVWPWNNIDLYSTVDTFLNHGIFAFSKTTSGPERRIDYLNQMLENLFRSLKFDSFPKKCLDWSKIICDLDSFHDRLALAPLVEETQEAKDTRKVEVQKLSSVNKNKLTQELTCIMFSSLSLQQFGAKDVDFRGAEQPEPNSKTISATPIAPETNKQLSPFSMQLAWDKQIRKALKLYTLSREALTDEQWLGLYQQLHDLWSQMKVSDRVIMVGRIVQLITNCHMPKEILESALWKDIYKYKNALNQIGDIVIEELNRSSENGKFTIEQLALGSKHLDDILTRFLSLLPKLIESLSKTIVDQLPELVSRFFHEKSSFFKAPCKGHSFSDLIPNLDKYHNEIVGLELLVCKQLRIKPSITMAQINNLTNEFLAMAFNFTSFSSFQNLPRFQKFISGNDQQVSSSNIQPSVVMVPAPINMTMATVGPMSTTTTSTPTTVDPENEKDLHQTDNGTSIIDELAANPRLAQIVAILQSSALDPPEIHAELPELDWVEAGTSVALFYESIQRLLSHEGGFSVFPELVRFQDDIQAGIEESRIMFTKFSKRDPIHLVAYSFDTVMPILLRTFQPLDSFHSECLSTFRDIFGRLDSTPDGSIGKESRQWQCAISSTNFAFYSLNNLIRTFNSMLRNILNQMSKQHEDFFKAVQHTPTSTSANTTSGGGPTCVLFDGSVTTLMDNLPQLIDLALETVLIASTNPNQQQSTLKDTLCSTNHTLDPLSDRAMVARQVKLREAVCHLLHESSIATCSEALKVDQWAQTMKELNATWFQSSAISVEPSFRGILQGAHEFLELFGKVKPSSMSDGLIARVLNLNSYWTGLVNKIVSTVEKYREKRFELALQVLMPIIYDNLPMSITGNDNQSGPEVHNNQTSVARTNRSETRKTLKTSILTARAIILYLDNLNEEASGVSSANNGTLVTNQQVDKQLETIFEWADKHSVVMVEVLLRTLANNITKLESLAEHTKESQFSTATTWKKFCSSPVDTYLELDKPPADVDLSNRANLLSHARFIEMNEAKTFICNFEWASLEEKLLAVDSAASDMLEQYSDKQLARILLTKWGQVLDLVFAPRSTVVGSSQPSRFPKFLSINHWQSLQEKLPQIAPQNYGPSDFTWVWEGFEKLVAAMDAGTNQTSDALLRILDQLNCALDAVKGGLTWDNLANIYQDRQDILAAHSTINNGIALASAGANTFISHKKFQKFLNDFVRPRVGLNAFCDMRDKLRLEGIFSTPHKDVDISTALESFQELICDTNIENLAQNINPISVCYQTVPIMNISQKTGPLTDIMDRFFKLASLAVLDAKLIDSNDAKPPIFDKSQWDQLRTWWLNQTEVHQGNSGLALTLVRIFQTMDSFNSDHVVWKALFRSVYETSEVAAYLIRAAELEHQALQAQDQTSRLAMVKEVAQQIDTAMKSTDGTVGRKRQQQQLASTLTNVMFPEANNFISFKTFKHLRYIKSISDYFNVNPAAQEETCRNLTMNDGKAIGPINSLQPTKLDLIGYKLDTIEKLNSLLCHYHSSQWLTAMNIILSSKTSSLSKKVNYMTKYLSIYTKNYKEADKLQSFIHSQQLENIEAVANTTVSYLIAFSLPFKTLTLSKISNISWHSLPGLLDSIDAHLCASKYENTGVAYKRAMYEPKKPELETIICKLPSWNMTQVYNHLSENFDLQNMISIVTQNNRSAAILGISSESTTVTKPMALTTNNQSSSNQQKTCITPFKFASKWLNIIQQLIDDMMSKSSRDKIRKCFGLNKKGQPIPGQALRYVKLINSLLSSVNDLTVNNSWHVVKKTWNSISYAILSQTSASASTTI